MAVVMNISAPVRGLVAAVAEVAAAVPADLPGPVALEDLRALLAAREQLDAALLPRLRDMELRQLHDLDALPSASAWVAAQGTSLDRGVTALARRMERLPSASSAVDAGRLSLAQAAEVGRALEKVRGFLDRPDGLIDGLPAADVLRGVIVRGVRQLVCEAMGGLADDDPRLRELSAELEAILVAPTSEVARVEAAFVALALRVERGDLKRALGVLVDALLPVQLEERSEKASRLRALALVKNDTRPGWRLEGDLDDDLGEKLFVSFEAAMAGDPANPEDTALAAERREAGEEPYAPGPGPRPRTRLQLRHDALNTIVTDWLDSGIAGTRGKVVPHLSIICGFDTMHGEPGALPARGASGASLALSLVRRWACDSAMTRFVLSLGGRVIEMSHTERTLKHHERRAKLVETGGRCQAAWCHHPPGTTLIPHHPEAWAKTKTTSFYDTVMVCPSHHHDIHEGGKTIRLRDGRLLNEYGWVPEIRAA